MKVSIIPSDTWAAVDGVGYNGVDMSSVPSDVHAVQFNDGAGWIEYEALPSGEHPANTPIYNLGQFQAVLDSWAKLDEESKNPPPQEPPTAQQNKTRAAGLLTDTDWTQIPSIADPAQSNPYLANVSEFTEYRNAIREIAVNPVAGDINWPIKPDAVWV